MEQLKGNSNQSAHLDRRSFFWLIAATVTFLAVCNSVGATRRKGNPAWPADNPGSSAPAAGDLSPHLCGRTDCPVSTDAAGNMWCWCRTMDVRDLCD
jgi:hypothetical protein